MADNLQLIGSTLGTLVKTCEAWKDKRVQKTGQALGIYTKLSKTIVMKKYCGEEVKYRPRLESSSLKLQQSIMAACEKDKSLSNLKGKAKELQNIIKAM